MRIENSSAELVGLIAVLICSVIVSVQPHPLVADGGMLAALRSGNVGNDEAPTETLVQVDEDGEEEIFRRHYRPRHHIRQNHQSTSPATPSVEKVTNLAEEDSSSFSGRRTPVDTGRPGPCDRRPGAKRSRGCVVDRRRPERQPVLPSAGSLRQAARKPTAGKKVVDPKKKNANAGDKKRVIVDEAAEGRTIDPESTTVQPIPQPHQQHQSHHQTDVVSPPVITGGENKQSFEELMAARRATLLKYQEELIQTALRKHLNLQNQNPHHQHHQQPIHGGPVEIPSFGSASTAPRDRRLTPVETPPLLPDFLASGALLRQQLDLGHHLRPLEDDVQADEVEEGIGDSLLSS